MPAITLPDHFGFWQVLITVAGALGVGGLLKIWATTKSTIVLKRVDELAEIRKGLEEKITAQETHFDKEMESFKAEVAKERKEAEKEREAMKEELKNARKEVERIDRELFEERSGRQSFEDKVLFIIEYRWTDKEAVLELAKEIKTTRAKREGRKPTHTPSRYRLLIIDDEKDTREMFKIMLSKEGYDVATASGGAEGLQQLTSALELGRPFSMVLLDYNMPEMAGDVVARRIRGGGNEVPITFLTASSDSMFPVGICVEVSATKLKKPCTLEMLTTIIKEVLN